MSNMKPFRASTVVVVSAVIGAAALAAGRSKYDARWSSTGSAAALASEDVFTTAMSTPTALPPGHPPVESSAATSMLPSPGASPESSLSWKAIDNALEPILARYGRLDLPASLVFVSMLGGLVVVAPTGILLGPIVVRLAKELIVIAREERELRAP